MTGYSRKNRLVFIHIPKNAGTSITKWIKKELGGEALWPNTGGKHYDIDAVRKGLRKLKIRDELTYFAVVRNPWDRLVSVYHFYKGLGKVDVEFADYVRGLDWGCATKPQHEYVDEDTMILRYENLKKEFAEKIVKPYNKRNPDATLLHSNKSKHESFEQYYTEELIEIVAQQCAVDIEMFGYKRPSL